MDLFSKFAVTQGDDIRCSSEGGFQRCAIWGDLQNGDPPEQGWGVLQFPTTYWLSALGDIFLLRKKL